MVCPKWFSAPYWPLLFPNGVNPIRAVKDMYEIPCSHGVLIPGRGNNDGFILNMRRSTILAIRIDFSY